MSSEEATPVLRLPVSRGNEGETRQELESERSQARRTETLGLSGRQWRCRERAQCPAQPPPGASERRKGRHAEPHKHPLRGLRVRSPVLLTKSGALEKLKSILTYEQKLKIKEGHLGSVCRCSASDGRMPRNPGSAQPAAPWEQAALSRVTGSSARREAPHRQEAEEATQTSPIFQDKQSMAQSPEDSQQSVPRLWP